MNDQHSQAVGERAPFPLQRIDAKGAAERVRLLREAGLPTEPPRHFRRPVERPFTKAERGRVTLLFGGLTLRQDRLMRAALDGMGYRAELVPMPTRNDFQAGKEYGNNGQCNPTYFTVGTLVNHLKRLRDEEGVPTDTILSDYVFVTAGTCGPCRFGMYEAEYRLALRNAGFEGFRVLVFDQEGGLAATVGLEAGLEMNSPFFLTLLNAVLMGDLLNAVANQIRPFETEPGQADRVFERCMAVCEEALRSKEHGAVRKGALARLLAKTVPVAEEDVAAFLDQLLGVHYIRALERCRRIIDSEIEVDYTRPKPIAKITGEFWAQTTEGEGNFNMFPFLESEGAEVLVEPLGTWLAYMVSLARLKARDRRGLDEGGEPPAAWNVKQRLGREAAYRGKAFVLALTEKVLVREYERMRAALGGTAHPLVNQLELQRIGHPYYNARSEGGEGYLEVAKKIYYINRHLAHFVLSLKPFGCMPSTQSDGAQAVVVANYPDMIFLPVETSGEGEINARSRVQMALGEAKAKCKNEFKAALARTGYSLADIRAFVAERPALRRPLQQVAETEGVVGRAANFVLHVARLMDREPAWTAHRMRPAAA